MERFDRYEVKKELGRGGMATVYLAHDPRFGRDVALKVMNQALRDDPTFRGRFEREARTVASLEHPAIVPVYDFGEDHDQLYLVMRYMPGGSLADRIEGRPLTLEEVLPILQRVGSALDHAHQIGVVHRDLKPANILFDQYQHAFLSDFGIVKLAQETVDLTGSGVIGTPAYMSPEQIYGEEALDGRSDLYTLGIILYECLTGRKPFPGETSVKQMMAHVLNPTPSILEARPDLPIGCEQVIQKALSKQRERRYDSAAQLTEDLTLTLHPPPAKPAPEAAETEAETADLPTMTVIDTPPAAARPAPRLPKTMTFDIMPPPPRTERPTKVGDSALEFETPSGRKQAPPPAAPPAGRKRPWPWVVVALAVILLLLWGVSVLYPGQPPPPTVPVVAAPDLAQTGAITETAVMTGTAVVTPMPTPRPTSTLAPTSTPLPTPDVSTFGRSARGTPLLAYQFGAGGQTLLLVGGIHGGFAPGSVRLAEELINYFTDEPADVPADVTLIIVPELNPDSEEAPGQLSGRLNGNGVDLNRNWNCRWTADPVWGGVARPGLGGTAPFSEPEVAALVSLTEAEPVQAVVFWQGRAALGLASPGACGEEAAVSRPLAQTYGVGAGYRVADFEALVDQEVNGDATNWLDSQGIPAISVLLPDYDESDFEANLTAVLAVLEWVAGGMPDPETETP